MYNLQNDPELQMLLAQQELTDKFGNTTEDIQALNNVIPKQGIAPQAPVSYSDFEIPSYGTPNPDQYDKFGNETGIQPIVDANGNRVEDISRIGGVPAQQDITPTEPAQQEAKVRTMYDLINAQKPTDNTAEYEARARKAALMSGIGQAFGNIAGVVAGKDARIPQLQQDQNIQKLYAMSEQNAAKQEMLKRNWEQRLGQAGLQDAQMELSNKKLTAQQEAQAQKDKQKAELDFINLGLKKQGLDNQKAHNDNMAYIAELNAKNKKLSGAGKTDKPFFSYNDVATGKQIPLREDQVYMFYNDMLKALPNDPEIAKNMNALKGVFNIAPYEGVKQMVTFYLDLTQRREIARLKSANLDVSKNNAFRDTPTVKAALAPPPEYNGPYKQDTAPYDDQRKANIPATAKKPVKDPTDF